MSDSLQKVIKAIADLSGTRENAITPETTMADLDMDSLDIVELVMELETVFDKTINDDKAMQCKTVADLVNLMEGEA